METMKEYIKKALEENNVGQKDSINGMMKAELVSCDEETCELTLRFPLSEWQKNRAGVLHGGMFAVAFDITVSMLARYVTNTSYIPTLSMDIKYLRPVTIKDKLIVTARAIHVGKTVSNYEIKGMAESTGKVVALSSVIHYNTEDRSNMPKSGQLRKILNESDRL